ELVQVERIRLRSEIGSQTGNVNDYDNDKHRNDGDGNVKPRPQIPWWPKAIARWRPQICGIRFQACEGLDRPRYASNAQLSTPNGVGAQRFFWVPKLTIRQCFMN